MYLDKEKIQALIDQQRTILADVDYLDLDSVAKIVENFDNPVKNDENLSEGDELFRRQKMFYHYTWGFAIPTSHIPIIFIFSYYSLLAAVFKSVGAPDGCKGQNIWNSQKSISLG